MQSARAQQAPTIAAKAPLMDPPVHRSVSSHELMAGERVIVIRHGQEEYRLRVTASNKLILTK